MGASWTRETRDGEVSEGFSMAEFMKRHGTEEQCHGAVVAQRWPDGFVCPDCGEAVGHSPNIADQTCQRNKANHR
jgi:hypothetical protein